MNPGHPNPFQALKPSPPTTVLWGPLLVLVAIVFTAFASSVQFGFINYDDPHYITDNPNVNSGVSLVNLKWAFVSTGETNLWSPATFISHQVDVSLAGLNPAWHHAVNIFWHVIAVIFLFLTARKLTNSALWSFFIALLWAIHPEKVQSVAWLSERKDVLSGAFFFASIHSYACWKLHPRKRPLLFCLSLLFFVIALMSKPSVVPLPLVLFVLFHLNLQHPVASARGAILPLLPFLTAAFATAILALYFQSIGTLSGVGEQLSASQKATHILGSFIFYLERFFWPHPGQLWFLPSDVLHGTIVSISILVLSISLVLWLESKEKLIALGAAIYTILWLPVSGLVSVSEFIVADRYSYLPQIGIVLMVVGLARLLAKTLEQTSLAALALATFSLFLLVLQQEQLPVWKNNATLFGHEMSVNPKSLLAPIHYASDFEDDEPGRALEYYKKAHQNDPHAGIALAKMGQMQKKLGRMDEALASFQEGTRVSTPIRENWTLLLLMQVELRRHEQAEETITRGLEYDPGNWAFIMNSGNFYLLSRKLPEKALPFFQKAHAMDPTDQRAIKACADCHRALGNETELRRFESLLKQAP